MDVQENPIDIQPAQYRDAIQSQSDFYIQFSVYTKEVESLYVKMMRAFLSRHDMLYLRDVILTIAKELITNAVKANAKRIYFKLKGYDIDNPADYLEGMKTFKTDVLHDNSETIRTMIQTSLRVRSVFMYDNGKLWIKIINNISIVPAELAKIQEKIKTAYYSTDISDAMAYSIDDIEGAGLGLIMAVMVYKNAGFSADDFTITSDENKTVSSISLYKRADCTEIEHKIADEILKEIETLPTFPDQLRKIELMCSDPECTVLQISDVIKQDVALATSLLKLANSAGYITMRRAETIEDAVKRIGLNGIKTLILATGVNTVVESRYKQYKELWTDSYKRAFYAHKIAIQVANQSISENAYLGGLLSEIGRIVLLSVKKETIDMISNIVGDRNSGTIDIIEEMALGISHARLGSLIAQKWKFPDALVRTIEFFPKPYMAPDENRDIAFSVHLAYIFTLIERKRYRFEIVDDEVLDYFHLSNKETFEKLHGILKQAYSQKII
jgi:HD-like signal output (HDOD) protein